MTGFEQADKLIQVPEFWNKERLTLALAAALESRALDELLDAVPDLDDWAKDSLKIFLRRERRNAACRG